MRSLINSRRCSCCGRLLPRKRKRVACSARCRRFAEARRLRKPDGYYAPVARMMSPWRGSG
jgi:hypothetical protein